MVDRFRYPQFCPIARAAEILGQRWMLLVFRELFAGPQRFSDLRRRLSGVSPSVLAERLASLEEAGLVGRRELPPPAAAMVYELTEDGRAFEPALLEITRWGIRLMQPPQPGDHLEPDWVRIGVRAFARRGPAPARSFALHMPGEPEAVRICVEGGKAGTRLLADDAPVEATVTASPMVLLGLLSGTLDPIEALRIGAIAIDGDASGLPELPQLFEMIPSAPDADLESAQKGNSA